MPTKIPNGEKDAFLAIVAQVNPQEAEFLVDLLQLYTDIVPIGIGRQVGAFLSNNDYLTSAMAVFTDSNLVAAGIYNGKTGASGLNNPIMIVNSNYTGGIEITASSPPTQRPILAILGNSNIDYILVGAGANAKNIILGPGASVGYLDATASGALVNSVSVTLANNTKATLGYVVYGSSVNNVSVAQGATYGGVRNIPTGSCAYDVSDLATGSISHNSVELTWIPPNLLSPPVGILGVNIKYRKKGSSDWLAATDATGLYNKNGGYTFTELNQDTFYEFQVSVLCVNGGESGGVVVSAQTACCC